MTDIQTRPFSKNYSGLINQTVIAIGITVLCVGGQEIMKRVRRGKMREKGMGSRESWEFGYLYQGRCWARYPSPPSPRGWPLSWVPRVMKFPEQKINELRGLDAALYIRFLRGCCTCYMPHRASLILTHFQ
ncbi:integral membrane protein [Moniliophthora roreri MCA 2997]|uniref:Integral membrane protein n=1 Tax=Moniliophthora roreri (strain MCA 2997) TaxID=1381753 RepID=V2X9M9_MONRO|nr:integral membrane protein [Moniliophthora roreri MCA 2997]